MSKKLVTNLNRLIQHPRGSGRLGAVSGRGGFGSGKGVGLGSPTGGQEVLPASEDRTFWLHSVNPSSSNWCGVKNWVPPLFGETTHSSGVPSTTFGVYTSIAIIDGVPAWCDVSSDSAGSTLITRVRNLSDILFTYTDSAGGLEAINGVGYGAGKAFVLYCYRDDRRPVVRRYDPSASPWAYESEFALATAPRAVEAAVGSPNWFAANDQNCIAGFYYSSSYPEGQIALITDHNGIVLKSVTTNNMQFVFASKLTTGIIDKLGTDSFRVMEFNANGQQVSDATFSLTSVSYVVGAADGAYLGIGTYASTGLRSDDRVKIYERTETAVNGLTTSVAYGALDQDINPSHGSGTRAFAMVTG